MFPRRTFVTVATFSPVSAGVLGAGSGHGEFPREHAAGGPRHPDGANAGTSGLVFYDVEAAVVVGIG